MKWIKVFVVLLVIALTASAQAQQDNEISITWYGHACYLITTTQGTQIITDPIDMAGYKIPQDIHPALVTVSHNHRDHDAVEAVAGEPEVLYGKTSAEIGPERKCIDIDEQFKDVKIYTVCSNHFPPEESPLLNAIFVFEFDGLRLAHLGDLGVTLTKEQIEAIGEIDILMIPVGGKYTISMSTADSMVSQLKPKIGVFPMHYKTAVADFVPDTADDFLKGKDESLITRITGNTYTVDVKNKPEGMRYIVMNYMAAKP